MNNENAESSSLTTSSVDNNDLRNMRLELLRRKKIKEQLARDKELETSFEISASNFQVMEKPTSSNLTKYKRSTAGSHRIPTTAEERIVLKLRTAADINLEGEILNCNVHVPGTQDQYDFWMKKYALFHDMEFPKNTAEDCTDHKLATFLIAQRDAYSCAPILTLNKINFYITIFF
jgi:hypothetical protein